MTDKELIRKMISISATAAVLSQMDKSDITCSYKSPDRTKINIIEERLCNENDVDYYS